MRTLGAPRSEIIFYKEGETVLMREWLKNLSNKVQKKCLTFIAQLEMQGHELRRPVSDLLLGMASMSCGLRIRAFSTVFCISSWEEMLWFFLTELRRKRRCPT